jgi:hypothetical protein
MRRSPQTSRSHRQWDVYETACVDLAIAPEMREMMRHAYFAGGGAALSILVPRVPALGQVDVPVKAEALIRFYEELTGG